MKNLLIPARIALVEVGTVSFLGAALSKIICERGRNGRVLYEMVFIKGACFAVDGRGASVSDNNSGIMGGIIIF